MKTKHLRGIPPFEGLSDSALDRVARACEAEAFGAGDTIVEQGEFSLRLFVIAEGEAAVFQKGVKIARLGAGEFFGEVGVLPHGELAWGRRSATVVAASPVKTIAISGHEVRELVGQVPEFGAIVQAAAAERAVH